MFSPQQNKMKTTMPPQINMRDVSIKHRRCSKSEFWVSSDRHPTQTSFSKKKII